MELNEELKTGKSGINWYDQKMKDAMSVAAKIYPASTAIRSRSSSTP